MRPIHELRLTEIDQLEDRVSERIELIVFIGDKAEIEIGTRNKRNGKKRSCHLRTYRGQRRYIIRVDGRTFTL